MGPESKRLVTAGFQQVSAALKEVRNTQLQQGILLATIAAKLGVTADDVEKHDLQLRAHGRAINEHFLREYANGR